MLKGAATAMTKKQRIPTTLSDLIAAAGEVAFEYSNSDREAYNLAQFALVELLKKTATPLDSDKQLENLPSPSELVH
jgi:hypothetical protein